MTKMQSLYLHALSETGHSNTVQAITTAIIIKIKIQPHVFFLVDELNLQIFNLVAMILESLLIAFHVSIILKEIIQKQGQQNTTVS